MPGHGGAANLSLNYFSIFFIVHNCGKQQLKSHKYSVCAVYYVVLIELGIAGAALKLGLGVAERLNPALIAPCEQCCTQTIYILGGVRL